MAKAKAKPQKVSEEALEAIFQKLSADFPSTDTELTYKNPYELLIAVILSAQCTDARVNLTTPALFAKYPTPKDLAKANPKDVEKLIHSCGFYRAKTKNIIACAKSLVENFGGEVPRTLDELVTLGGVGRKTASVVLNQAYGLPAIAVDTHVKRVSNRLGWAKSADPVKIEWELRELLPEARWASVNGLLILHGRRTCKARKPACDQCSVSSWCAFYRNGVQ
jgi:endonuclease III